MSPNQARTLHHAPAGAAGLAAAFLQVAQRIAAAIALAAVSGVYLTAAVGICVAMLAASAVCALLAERSPVLSVPAAG